MSVVIGLTGKTGAGKSTVSDIFRANGAYIIDGDKVAREVLVCDKRLLIKLSRSFGADIIKTDGTLDRRLLAEKAFKDEDSTKLLNSILHPAINDYIAAEVKKASESFRVIIVDAAAIIESGFADKCDRLVVVDAPENIRKSRITARDNIDEKDAEIRIRAQKPDSFYIDRADYVIRNFSPYDLKTQTESVLKEIFTLGE